MHVMTRSADALACSAPLRRRTRSTRRRSPVLFAPAGDIVPAALAALDRGGAAIAGIHLSASRLRYEEHLFEERQLRSHARPRHDGEEFLALAAAIGIRVETTP